MLVPFLQDESELDKPVINECICPDQLRIVNVDNLLHRDIDLHEVIHVICDLQKETELCLNDPRLKAGLCYLAVGFEILVLKVLFDRLQ